MLQPQQLADFVTWWYTWQSVLRVWFAAQGRHVFASLAAAVPDCGEALFNLKQQQQDLLEACANLTPQLLALRSALLLRPAPKPADAGPASAGTGTAGVGGSAGSGSSSGRKPPVSDVALAAAGGADPISSVSPQAQLASLRQAFASTIARAGHDLVTFEAENVHGTWRGLPQAYRLPAEMRLASLHGSPSEARADVLPWLSASLPEADLRAFAAALPGGSGALSCLCGSGTGRSLLRSWAPRWHARVLPLLVSCYDAAVRSPSALPALPLLARLGCGGDPAAALPSAATAAAGAGVHGPLLGELWGASRERSWLAPMLAKEEAEAAAAAARFAPSPSAGSAVGSGSGIAGEGLPPPSGSAARAAASARGLSFATSTSRSSVGPGNAEGQAAGAGAGAGAGGDLSPTAASAASGPAKASASAAGTGSGTGSASAGMTSISVMSVTSNSSLPPPAAGSEVLASAVPVPGSDSGTGALRSPNAE